MVSGSKLNLCIQQNNQKNLNKNNYGKTKIFTFYILHNTAGLFGKINFVVIGIIYIVIQKEKSVENWNLTKYLY